ncbi:MAG: cytochrome P450 [Paracoccaceae bacterium]|nr:cytochrome P450 [Paracoccaceae bacterium]
MTGLSFSEEILLLLHDEHSGDIAPGFPPEALHVALAGAVLMDLALANRIDTDPEHLFVVDGAPMDDDLFDPTLAAVAESGEARDVGYWVERISGSGEAIREKALKRLVNRGILEAESGGSFFFSRPVARSRRYPEIDGKKVEEVQLRIMRALFLEEVPGPRDIVIVGLANACGVFERILSKEERIQVGERIDLLSQLDLIGRSVSDAIRELRLRSSPAIARPQRARPRARGLPLLGNLFDLLRPGTLRQFLTEQYRDLGPLFELRALNRRLLVMAGTEANLFLSREGKTCLRSHETWHGMASDLNSTRMLSGLDGTEHLRLRRIMQDGFSFARIAGNLDTAVDIARRDIETWSPGQLISPFNTLRRIILEQIGMICTGVSPNAWIDDLTVFLGMLLKTRVVQTHPPLLLRMPRVRRAGRRLDELYEKVLAEHRRTCGNEHMADLVDDVLEAHRADRVFLPETNLKITVLAPFFAGLDTVPAISAFMLYNVLKYPDLLARVRAEADAWFTGGLSAQEMRRMDVTHRVALETLRIYPVGVGLKRTASNSFEFAGYTVPAGSSIFVAMSVPHALPEYYPDPERFDIDRYKPERAEHRQPGAFAPFGLGTHFCLGSRFAEAQIVLNVATILREVDLQLEPPNYEMKTSGSQPLKPGKSFRIRILGRRRH